MCEYLGEKVSSSENIYKDSKYVLALINQLTECVLK